MKKLQNDKKRLVDEAMAGYAAAHRDVLEHIAGTRMMARRHPKEPGKVRLMMGNGGGHEPAVIGWVGQGMLDLNVVGDVFTAPSGKMIYQGISRLAETGPVILFVQNHAGDVMNAELAMDMAEDLPVKSVLFYDDIASAPKGQEQERRGMGGMLFYAKICSALAERGALQDEIIAMFEAVRDRTRTLSVAINGGTHPVTGLPISGELGENEIEIGMGVHGEGGANRIPLPTSRQLASILCDRLLEDAEYEPGSRLLVMVNGAGGMTMMEMATLYGDVEAELRLRGFEPVGCKVGNYLTTQETSGISLSLVSVNDEMLELWRDPCNAPAF